MDKDIQLKEEALTQDDNFSTALGDRFSYHVFSDEFIASEKQEKEEAKAEEEQMLKTVLNGIPDKDQNEEYFNIVMQAEPIQIIKSGDNLQGSADSTTMQKILPFFAGILIVTVIFTYIKKKKKQ